jgi:glutamine amidotransferase
MIAIINYGVGNLRSITNALNELSIKNIIINDPLLLKNFNKIILPGVGSYFNAIQKLKRLNFYDEIKEFAEKKKYILGICLGMQLLSTKGYEDFECEGLDLISGDVTSISKDKKISHVGWNDLIFKKKSQLFKDIKNNTDFYFVHSYSFKLKDKKNLTSYVQFQNTEIASSVEKNNIYGVQFHPEKSLYNGLRILKNYSKF